MLPHAIHNDTRSGESKVTIARNIDRLAEFHRCTDTAAAIVTDQLMASESVIIRVGICDFGVKTGHEKRYFPTRVALLMNPF